MVQQSPGRRWLGKLGVQGVFDGEHSFVLTANADGSTRLIHGESFSGVLVALMKRTIDNTQDGFTAFNQALKRRIEHAQHSL